MKYTFSIDNPQQQYIAISCEISSDKKETTVHFPTWRPGRYEIGDFAKNVKGFSVKDENGKALAFHKTNKDTWLVKNNEASTFVVSYSYYAAELNAGSTFLSKDQLYVNPVNCCVFTPETMDEQQEVILNIPKTWTVAGAMYPENGSYFLADYHQLVDTPFICSATMQHKSFESHGTKFHIWFQGEVKPKWEVLLRDFEKYTDEQIKRFSEFPVKEYHYLFQITPTKGYHGVEHKTSTVILLGPSYEVFEGLYTELLGVSSHELYHTWNVKSIRPIEMQPYDYTQENFSPLGYLCEGVTTYLGDLFLYQSGVFDEKQYFKELNNQLQRHFDNHGRFNYSVAESSWDTWLDGYVAGAPNRKVSIYTEGCLLAFVTDVWIRKLNNENKSIHDVMRALYYDFALKGKGVSEADYKAVVENVAGESYDWLFNEYIHGTKAYEAILCDALDWLGLKLDHIPSPKYSHARLGFKSIASAKDFVIKAIYVGGPADLAGLMLDDKVIAVNGYACEGELEKWLNYFEEEDKVLTINRNGNVFEAKLPGLNRNFYHIYSISHKKKVLPIQERAYRVWAGGKSEEKKG